MYKPPFPATRRWRDTEQLRYLRTGEELGVGVQAQRSDKNVENSSRFDLESVVAFSCLRQTWPWLWTNRIITIITEVVSKRNPDAGLCLWCQVLNNNAAQKIVRVHRELTTQYVSASQGSSDLNWSITNSFHKSPNKSSDD